MATAAVTITPVPPPLTVQTFASQFLDRHMHRFDDGLQAAAAAEREAVLYSGRINRGFSSTDRTKLGIAIVTEFNRRRQLPVIITGAVQ